MTVIAGRYELGALIGEGGMGAVYHGMDTRMKQPVAIKHLKPDLIAQDSMIVERFKREGEALRKLNHPNIVRVLAMLTEGSDHYIVMEFIGGGSLADLLRTPGQLSPLRVVNIALELADALARAHHLNIIHRDLKPGNVLMAGDGSIRLSDFGIAYLGDRSRVTQAHSVMGTLAYLSPEALDGRPLDTRADIWAFGVLLYESLTGKLPFVEDTPSATLMSIMLKPTPKPDAFSSDIPPSLVSLIYRMLEKAPENRIPSARLVAAELEAILKGDQSVLPAPTHIPGVENASDSLIQRVQSLFMELSMLADQWEYESKETTERVEKPSVDNHARQYGRGFANGRHTSATELRQTLTETQEKFGVTDTQTITYAAVSRKEAAKILDRAGLKVTNLYEDKGSIFTAIFPKLPVNSMDDRIRRLRDVAPEVVILENGKLPETGEPYIDFAFNSLP